MAFDPQSIRIVLFNSGLRHAFIKLSATFDERRTQCQAGLDLMQTLPQASKNLLEAWLKSYNVYKRCLYVIEETDRVETASPALQAGDFGLVGR